MKVITTTTSGGIDQDSVVKNEDGSYEIPSTVTLLANTEQAKMLARYESETTLTVALVYRGTPENAKKFLDKQDDFFLNYESDDEKSEPAETQDDGGNDGIVSDNADYYDVEEAVNNG